MRYFNRPLLLALFAGAVVSIASVSKGDEPVPPQGDRQTLRETVKQCLNELESSQRAVRIRAQWKLLDLGPQILPLLPPLDLISTAGTRVTVGRIRVTLERRKAQESVLPSHFSLNGEFTLEHILAELSAQSGNDIDFNELPAELRSRVFNVMYEKREFWPSLDDLALRAECELKFDGTRGIQLRPIPAGSVPGKGVVTYSGAFRIELESATVREQFGTKGGQFVRFMLGVASEPRLRPLFLKYAAKDIVCRLGKEGDLAPISPAAQYDHPLGEGGRYVRLTCDYHLPDQQTQRRPLQLAGQLQMQTAAGSEQIRFSDMSKASGVARRRGGVTVELEDIQVQKSEKDLHVRALVVYDVGGPAFESHRTWIFHNEVFLESESGERLTPSGYDTALQRDGVVAVDYHFPGVAGDLSNWSLVYVAPTLLLDVPIRFELPPALIQKLAMIPR